ncbi:MAG: S-methyl-5-thioribose-1-phosphate isomerase [Gammaproteobacteria bacterium]
MHDPLHPAVNPIAWADDALVLLDQRLLPGEVSYVTCRSAEAVEDAIREMVVRGAPAIGIAAAYGVALAARTRYAQAPADWPQRLAGDIARLRAARPTAVNLMWALDHMSEAIAPGADDPFALLLARARALHAADLAANRRMGDLGAALIAPGAGVLTHCNAGALATAGYGTALGVIRSGWRRGVIDAVYATETRPWLQGARLTAFELLADGIDVTLIADGAAAHLMASGRVQWVVTGADRIAANGDTANKIGTYALATLARAHGLRFMVAAPLSTIDRATPSGADIPIEHRAPEELTHLAGRAVAAPGVHVLNPVFDVTPAHLIDAIATEKGVIERPDEAAIAGLFEA